MIRPLLLLCLTLGCVLVITGVLLAGCDSTDAQDEFESQALAQPFEGITSMSSAADTIEVDEEDWRIAPRYVNSVEVVTPAYPNPTAGELVTLDIGVFFDDAIRGRLELWGYTNTQPRRLRRIDFIPDSREVGFYQFQFNPAISIQEPGIRRFFVFDGATPRQTLVTYGDVRLE